MNFYIEQLVRDIIEEKDKYSFVKRNENIFQQFFEYLKRRITTDIGNHLNYYVDGAYDAYVADKKICENCNGRGEISAGIPVSMAYHGTSYRKECPKCDGDGYIYDT